MFHIIKAWWKYVILIFTFVFLGCVVFFLFPQVEHKNSNDELEQEDITDIKTFVETSGIGEYDSEEHTILIENLIEKSYRKIIEANKILNW